MLLLENLRSFERIYKEFTKTRLCLLRLTDSSPDVRMTDMSPMSFDRCHCSPAGSGSEWLWLSYQLSFLLHNNLHSPVSCDREMTLARCWTRETLLRHSDISWHLIILIRLRSFLMPWSVERVASPVTGRRLGCQIMARIWFLMGRWCKRRGRSATLRIYIYTDKSQNFNEDTGVWSPLDFARQGFHQEVKTQGFNI